MPYRLARKTCAGLPAALLLLLTACVPTDSLIDPASLAALEVEVPEVIAERTPRNTAVGTEREAVSVGDFAGDVIVSGAVAGDGDYRLFDLGPGNAGDRWEVEAEDRQSGVTVILFDENLSMLSYRSNVRADPLTCVAHRSTSPLLLGVCARPLQNGAEFRLRVRRTPDTAIPPPTTQLVWLNFAGGSNVTVHGRRGLSFPAFDGAVLGPAYAAATAELKQAIMAAVRAVYADFNVLVLSSDDTPAPQTPHAVVHFGGEDDDLWGLADRVDPYNEDPGQSAIVYVDSYAAYATMQLRPEEMGTMIGNTAAHELGHLLGLYHVRGSQNLMDTMTGTAWDMTHPRILEPAELDPTVFPIGHADLPQLLADTVGWRAQP